MRDGPKVDEREQAIESRPSKAVERKRAQREARKRRGSEAVSTVAPIDYHPAIKRLGAVVRQVSPAKADLQKVYDEISAIALRRVSPPGTDACHPSPSQTTDFRPLSLGGLGEAGVAAGWHGYGPAGSDTGRATGSEGPDRIEASVVSVSGPAGQPDQLPERGPDLGAAWVPGPNAKSRRVTSSCWRKRAAICLLLGGVAIGTSRDGGEPTGGVVPSAPVGASQIADPGPTSEALRRHRDDLTSQVSALEAERESLEAELAGTWEKVAVAEARLEELRRPRIRREGDREAVKITEGETLAEVAAKLGVAVAVLRQANPQFKDAVVWGDQLKLGPGWAWVPNK